MSFVHKTSKYIGDIELFRGYADDSMESSELPSASLCPGNMLPAAAAEVCQDQGTVTFEFAGKTFTGLGRCLLGKVMQEQSRRLPRNDDGTKDLVLPHSFPALQWLADVMETVNLTISLGDI